ncbi:MAG: hydantoinase/oxoprolinase family protein [Rhodospirillaceae bacterium]|nr:hydantoinase/oxoprolinase family protein [Rhodospirillaceae bacterium]
MTKYRVSADIGGTFTDFVFEDETGATRIGKVPTTPQNPSRGVLDGLAAGPSSLGEIDFFVHGTTVGLNAFLERRGARTLLLMTAGISDSYTIARGHRTHLYQLQYRKPAQLVPRRDVYEIRERLAWDGSVIEPLNEADLQTVIEVVRAQGIPAIAICFLHAFTNQSHEQRAKAVLGEALPGVSISLSSDIAREWREYERASSVVMDAYVAPVVELYLKTLRSELSSAGMDKTIHVMRSSGGVMTDRIARDQPISTLLSGPVGGAIGCVQLAKDTGRQNLLGVDMGGTSFDLTLVVDGEPQLSTETALEGLPLLMSVVDIPTIGTGGGSIAWIEAGGLRVGPKSAGSQPGPACYGRGGTEPTVTDANLFLGRLATNSLLGGRMSLDATATAVAIAKLAGPLGMSNLELAEGILAISNAKMADAMRTITVEKGIDPRSFTLVAYGGAGPMNAAELAFELDIREILIPRFPGTFSAWGMLRSDIRSDFSVSFFTMADQVDPQAMLATCEALQAQGRELLEQEHVPADQMTFALSADLRYVGQEYTLSIPFGRASAIADILKAFHIAHERRFGHAQSQNPVEFVNLRLAAIGRLARARQGFAFTPQARSPQIGERDIVFVSQAMRAKVYNRALFTDQTRYLGPAVIEEESATTFVPPGYTFQLDDWGNILIQKEA